MEPAAAVTTQRAGHHPAEVAADFAERPVYLRGGDRRFTAGTCWVMQWMFPPPSRISRPGTPTTLRSGNTRFSSRDGPRIRARIQQRHHDAAIGDVEIRIGRRQPRHPPRAAAMPRRYCTPAASAAVIFSGPGEGSLCTLSLRPRASRAACSRSSASLDTAHCRIALVGGVGQAHLARPREAGQVVDVAIGLVVHHALAPAR